MARKKKRKEKQKGKAKPGVHGSKVFLYALGVAVLGGGAYLVYNKVKQKGGGTGEGTDATALPDMPASLPASSGSASFATSLVRKLKGTLGEGFPLKKGSKGDKVLKLQQALSTILGPAAMKMYGGVDGQFGPGTVKALKQAGYPTSIDEDTFNRITGGSGTSTAVQTMLNAPAVGDALYQAAQDKDVDGVLAQLKKVRNVSDYAAVNTEYKKHGFISKTIVTDLLNFVFKDDGATKAVLRNEFQRIGLKSDESGHWSLQGLPVYNDLVTLRDTFVIDPSNNKILVKPNVILGDEVNVKNGMTWFRSVENEILKVPTQDIKTVKND